MRLVGLDSIGSITMPGKPSQSSIAAALIVLLLMLFHLIQLSALAVVSQRSVIRYEAS
jgi:hypothetical protein